jgi:hypothetical protein
MTKLVNKVLKEKTVKDPVPQQKRWRMDRLRPNIYFGYAMKNPRFSLFSTYLEEIHHASVFAFLAGRQENLHIPSLHENV